MSGLVPRAREMGGWKEHVGLNCRSKRGVKKEGPGRGGINEHERETGETSEGRKREVMLSFPLLLSSHPKWRAYCGLFCP